MMVSLHGVASEVNGNSTHPSKVKAHSTPLAGTKDTNGTHVVNGKNGVGNGNSTAPKVTDTPPHGIDADQPIAIVGYACRLPGDVHTSDELWELCARGRSGWSEIPPERFSTLPFYHPNPSKAGCYNPIGGYFLKDDVARFDASFFNLTALEAISLDPQQRLLLEISFEALENSGAPVENLSGKNVGVFVGGSFADYELRNCRDIDTTPMFQATGCAPALLANRISYSFDFRGPSVTFDTACSSSLVALHHAVASIRSGESSTVVVGGAHLNILPDYFVTMSMSQLFNDTGKVFAFDQRAQSGFGRGEGVGCVVLKPLEAALRDRDCIRAVISSSGINQDGRTRGITMPNGDAQQELIREVYARAGLKTIDCGFAEMHGTGTKVGDPIEAKAVYQSLGQGRTPRAPLYIGSVKSNVGHLEGASGIASIIKAALMLEKELILPNTNYETPNEKIPLHEWNLRVATSVRPWPSGKKHVSVSNYGFGGTNAHVIVSKAPKPDKATLYEVMGTASGDSAGEDPKWKLFALSANDKDALEARMKHLGIYLQQRPEVFEKLLAGDLAYTLGQRRSHLSYRIAIAATSCDEFGIRLASARLSPVRVRNSPPLGFVFTGQGAQWATMGMELIIDYPVFASAIYKADRTLRKIGANFSLLGELCKDAKVSLINLAHISQPACTAVQIALTDLLRSWGIEPSAVVGHSSGEIACAYAAGIISADAAMALSYFRGQATVLLKEKHPEIDGTMLAVGAGPEAVQPMLKLLKEGYATIACINSPSSVTVSGDRPAVLELQKALEQKSVFNRLLKVDMAYHSNHIERVAVEYLASIKHINPNPNSKAVFHSSLLGRIAEPTEIGPEYWVKNLVSPVRFSDALASMFDETSGSSIEIGALVEVGPHAALQGPIKDTLKTLSASVQKTVYAATLSRGKSDTECAIQVAGTVFMKGTKVNFDAINFPSTGAKEHSLITDLPRYPWNHTKRYWHESRIAENHTIRNFARNDILGTLAEYSNDLEPTWRNIFRLEDLPWLRHHKMQGMPVFPMAGYISIALEAASQRAQIRNVQFDHFQLREVVVSSALVFDENHDVETTITLRPYTQGTRGYSEHWDEFRICSWQVGRGWVEHCHGTIGVRLTKESTLDANSQSEAVLSDASAGLSFIKKTVSEKVDVAGLYSTLDVVGATYGSTFQGLENAHSSDHHAFAELVGPDTKSIAQHGFEPELIIHPAFLDQFIQIVWPIFGAGRQGLETFYMPTFVREISLSRDLNIQPGDRMDVWASGSPNAKDPKPTSFDMFATKPGASEKPSITFEGLMMTPVRDGGSYDSSNIRNLCFKTTLEPVEESTQVNGEPKVNGDSAAELPAQSATHLDVKEEILVTFTSINDQALAINIAEALAVSTGKPASTVAISEIDATGKLVIVAGVQNPQLADLGSQTFAAIKKLFLNATGVIWIHAGAANSALTPEGNMILGVARTVRSETTAQIVTLGVEDNKSDQYQNITGAVDKILDLVWVSKNASFGADREFLQKDGELFVSRVVSDDTMNSFVHCESEESALQLQPFHQPGRRFNIAIGNYGALDTLYFVDDKRGELHEDEVEIEVKATGMNFKDIVVSMGQLAQPYIGVECAGIVTEVGKNVTDLKVGQRVMAMTEGAYSTYARCLATSAHEIPETLSFEEACTIPVVFCTAYYGLIELAHLEPGEKVLIHAAAGGVGQAAIMLAQMVGAEIFATVGSQNKKDFIASQYAIPEDHIFYSRDTSFGPAIRRVTDNKGVDVVLNSLAGDILRETWDCVAPFGRFIEIGKADITTNTRLEMNKFEMNVTFASVDLTKVAAFKPRLMSRLLKNVCRLLRSKLILPIAPIQAYPISQVEQAFRLLQSGKSMGKLVIVPQEDDQVTAAARKTSKSLLTGDGTYVIVGGTGGLGRSLTKWMVEKGARNVVLLSRNASIDEKLGGLIRQLKPMGAKIIAWPCDVTSEESVAKLIKEGLKGLPPVKGVVQGAMVLRDVLFENMTHQQWKEVVQCKVKGTWNLHNALLNTKLDFFIALSSVAGIVGNRGQAAYAAANAFLDSFMQWRNTQGLAGTSLDLTAVTGVGYLAENEEREEQVKRNLGGESLVEKEVLALFAAAITGETRTACGNHCITGLNLTPATVNAFWASDPRFKHILAAVAGQGEEVEAGGTLTIAQAIQTLEAEEAVEAVYQNLVTKLAAVLMISVDEMEPNHTVSSYGLDSLVAIEIRNWIARNAEANIQVLELLTSPSLMGLAKLIITKSKLTPAA